MGGVEDDEPPTKRVKVSLGGRGDSQIIHLIRSLPSALYGWLKGIIKKMEFVRIITEALYSLGYEKSGSLLEEESGIPLHSSLVGLLRKQVLNGNWEESVVTLHKIGILEENTLKSASFLILEQKFLNFLPKLVGSSNGEVVSGKSRYDTRKRRLENLVEQALNVQRGSCVFHNSLDSALSLFSDHQCGKDQIPSRTSQVLESHDDEVWFLLFSHDGKYLASSSNDRSAIIWEVNGDGVVTLKQKLTGHQRPIMSISWSPDSRQILTCGLEDVIRLWDVNSGLSFVSCEWHPDGNRIFTGLIDKSICMWDLDGNELECWKGSELLKFQTWPETSILILDRVAKVEKLIEEDQVITSFSLSRDNKYLLVDLFNQEVHLWSLEGDFKLVSSTKVTNAADLLSGLVLVDSSKVSLPVEVKILRKITWAFWISELCELESKNPHMLASASDDRTIRIWGLNSVNLKRKEKQENGVVHHCNGRA
ncbi:hypothetical protein MKW92_032135 [Papaver armeniacum]|nr:hypothetical protein MKW92_032135 [Papaver armeniacum]